MVNIELLKQLRAFARQDGMILAVVWVLGFVLTMSGTLVFIGNVLILSTPFVVYWRLRIFRDEALSGVISFRRALTYCWYTFMYTILLFALIQYLYFTYIDNVEMQEMISQSMSIMEDTYKSMGMSKAEIDNVRQIIFELRPIDLVGLFMLQNVVMSFFMSLIIAGIGMKKENLKK